MSRPALAISSRKIASASRSIRLLLGDLADDSDGKTGTGEGLTLHQILGKAQLPSQRTNLILKQHPQRLNDLLEIHIIRQTAHIMMALNHSCIAGTGLDDVGIDGALNQIVHGADLLAFLLEYPDATEESTPPDSASSTLPSPTFSRMEAMAVLQ